MIEDDDDTGDGYTDESCDAMMAAPQMHLDRHVMALLMRKQITANEALVLGHVNMCRNCNCDEAWLGLHAGQDEKIVRNTIDKLIAKGLLTKEPGTDTLCHYEGDNYLRTNFPYINFVKVCHEVYGS